MQNQVVKLTKIFSIFIRMVFLFRLSFLLFLTTPLLAQQGFRFPAGKERKISIPFEFVNNLVIVPVEVNGVELHFLLDTGIDETILFSLADQEVSFNNVERIKFKGLGNQDAVEGLKSSGNTMRFRGDFIDWHHDIYIIIDENFNVSSDIGTEINGILGFHFFEGNLIEIDYESRRITVHPESEKLRRKLKRNFTSVPITVEKGKPYLMAESTVSGSAIDTKLLIDTGNSDAIWLFENPDVNIVIPQSNIEDYLGRGFSGEVHGRRARMDKFRLDQFEFDRPIAAFPDSASIRNLNMVEGRRGSVGGEILRRFTVVFDYPRGAMYLKPNSQLKTPFQYNMSGLDVHHQGVTWVRETVPLQTTYGNNQFDATGQRVQAEFTYKFELKPVYAISSVREGSPAALAGLQKDDEIVSINGKSGHQYKLYQITQLLKSEDGRVIRMVINRKHQKMEFEFKLKSIL